MVVAQPGGDKPLRAVGLGAPYLIQELISPQSWVVGDAQGRHRAPTLALSRCPPWVLAVLGAGGTRSPRGTAGTADFSAMGQVWCKSGGLEIPG